VTTAADTLSIEKQAWTFLRAVLYVTPQDDLGVIPLQADKELKRQGSYYQMLDAGHWMLDNRHRVRFSFQYPVSRIQYLKVLSRSVLVKDIVRLTPGALF
jgi:hypothetical protein